MFLSEIRISLNVFPIQVSDVLTMMNFLEGIGLSNMLLRSFA
jgi:hypothetical protein